MIIKFIFFILFNKIRSFCISRFENTIYKINLCSCFYIFNHCFLLIYRAAYSIFVIVNSSVHSLRHELHLIFLQALITLKSVSPPVIFSLSQKGHLSGSFKYSFKFSFISSYNFYSNDIFTFRQPFKSFKYLFYANQIITYFIIY